MVVDDHLAADQVVAAVELGGLDRDGLVLAFGPAAGAIEAAAGRRS